MKLIEILVKHLNRWPDGVGEIEMHEDGEIFFDGNLAPKNFSIPQCTDGWRRGFSSSFSNAVTREQYEAALAASKEMLVNKPVTWDGQGLPPVGVKCEHCPGGTTQHEWEVVTVVAVYENLVSGFTDFWLVRENGSSYLVGNPYQFRALRTESERKRDEAIEEITNVMGVFAVKDVGREIYDAIAAGKIPGVKLEAPDA